MSENALALPEDSSVAKFADDEDFEVIAKSTGFLPYLQVVAKTSDLAAEGKAVAGNMIVKNGQEITDLGAQINGLVLGWRFRAMRFGDDDIVSVYDPKSEEFKKIMADADAKVPGCMYGPEFLIFSPAIPKGYALYLMGNNSARREAPNLKNILERWQKKSNIQESDYLDVPSVTLGSRFNKGRSFSWFIPTVVHCTAPIAPMPNPEDMAAKITDFNNPPVDERESVKDEGGRER